MRSAWQARSRGDRAGRRTAVVRARLSDQADPAGRAVPARRRRRLLRARRAASRCPKRSASRSSSRTRPARAAWSAPSWSRRRRRTATRCCSATSRRWRSTSGIYPKMPYDPVKDFTPIVRTVDVNYVLVVHPSVPAKTVRRAHRLREGESGQARLRLGGQRQPAASRRPSSSRRRRAPTWSTCRTRAAARWSPICSAAPCSW